MTLDDGSRVELVAWRPLHRILHVGEGALAAKQIPVLPLDCCSVRQGCNQPKEHPGISFQSTTRKQIASALLPPATRITKDWNKNMTARL